MLSVNPIFILFKTLGFLLLMFIFGNSAYSQNNNEGNNLLDSLTNIVVHPQNNISTASAYVGLSEILYVSNIDTVIPLCTKAIEIIDVMFKQSLAATQKEKKTLLKIKANALNNIGYVFDNRGRISKALEYYLKGLKIREAIDDKSGIAESLNNVGALYKIQGNNEKALGYYSRCLDLWKKTGNDNGVALVLSNIGKIYSDKSNWNKAIEYHTQSLKIYETTGDKKGIADLYNKIGLIYSNLKRLDKALEYYNKSLKIRKEIGDKEGVAISLYFIAKAEFDENRISNAEKTAMKSFNLSKELGFPARIKGAADLLYKINIKQNDWESAFKMYMLYIQMRDSISNEEIRKEALKGQLQYEYEKKESEVKAEQDRKAVLVAAERKRQLLFLWLVAAVALAVAIIAGVIYRSLRVTRKQKQVIETQKTEVEKQKHLIEGKQKEILDSIRYAKYLQDAILPPQTLVTRYLSDFFILYKPKDIVAGDFYWIEVLGDSQPIIFIAAADCTGHGVPGAMVSVVCSNALNRAVKEFGITEPSKILDKVRELVIETFEKSESKIKDGMDISLIALNMKTYELQFSGANNPLYVIKKFENDGISLESQVDKISDQLIEIKGDRMPVAIFVKMNDFTNHKIQLQKGDCIYLKSDGYEDQFGGLENKKFMTKHLKKLLLDNSQKPMTVQKENIETALSDWIGQAEQIDDIMVIGIKI